MRRTHSSTHACQVAALHVSVWCNCSLLGFGVAPLLGDVEGEQHSCFPANSASHYNTTYHIASHHIACSTQPGAHVRRTESHICVP
jgi:hypothetical protein